MKAIARTALLVSTLASLAAAPEARAISVALSPSETTATIGSPLFVDVVVGGLGDGNAPSLRVADFDVSFDPLVLGFAGALFGDELGSVAAGEAIATAGVQNGVLDVALVSLLSPGALDAGQPASFSIATLEFLPLMPGATALTLLQHDLGDAVSLPLSVSVATGTTITVVPEPRSGLLVGLSLFGAALSGIRSTRRRTEV